MVSVSVSCNDSEEKLISNMETQDDFSDDQVYKKQNKSFFFLS